MNITYAVAPMRIQPEPASQLAPREVEEVSNAASLTKEERQQVQELASRDREVRDHEEAHKRMGAQYTGSISYDYTTGPDGKRYAVSGEVPIDATPEEDPRETIDKMTIVIAAALAPTEPSAQDRAIARQAEAYRLIAQADLRASYQLPTEGEAVTETRIVLEPRTDIAEVVTRTAEEAYHTVREKTS